MQQRQCERIHLWWRTEEREGCVPWNAEGVVCNMYLQHLHCAILQFCIFREGLGLLLMCLACIHSVAEDWASWSRDEVAEILWVPFLHFTVSYSYVSWICIFKHLLLAEGWGGVSLGIEESLCAEDFLLHTWLCCTVPESAVLGATVKIMLTPMCGNMAKYDPNDKISKKVCFMSSMFKNHINDQHQFEEKCATIGNK